MRFAPQTGMSLDEFMKSRIIVQSPGTRIYDAVRAMEDNAVGAVLVHDGRHLVGIATDRDLTVKVIGDDLDAFDFLLQDVMSAPVVSVPSSATVADIAALMIERHVRRVPVVDGAAVVGMVTLDDLTLERAVDAQVLAAIVRGQLSQPSRSKPQGKVHPTSPIAGDSEAVALQAQRRHEARRRQTYAKLIARVMAGTGLDSAALAERALLIVVTAVIRRVTAEEAADFLAQLPGHLRDYAIANVSTGPDRSVRRKTVDAEVAALLDVCLERAAVIVRHVGEAISAGITRGALSDIESQLPHDMKEIFSAVRRVHPEE
jgi:CBS domain-containing protein/uncharacterized protein (DUF2267 family)